MSIASASGHPVPSSSNLMLPASMADAPSTFVESSPMKTANRLIEHRRDIAASIHAKDTTTDPQFLTNHLTASPHSLKVSVGGDKPLITAIKGAGTVERRIYEPLCDLLTKYSKRIYKSLPKSERPLAAYVFLDHSLHAPINHPYNPQNIPDLLCVVGPPDKWTKVKEGRPDYCKVPHHEIVTIVEVKAQDENGRVQLATYAFQLLEARPDMPGAYLAWASPKGYQIVWSDASGVVASEFTSWDEKSLLIAYVYSLYRPPSSHWLRDPSIFPMPKTLQPQDHVLWKIELKEPRRELANCESIFVGNSWGRRTNIFKQGEAPEIVVIKDSYRDAKRRYMEEILLDEIHKDGVYPGVVRPLFALPPKDKRPKRKTLPVNVPRTALPVLKPSNREAERVKARLVMGSYGEQLHQAKSVLHILKAFYDAIEVHRGLVNEKKILHRDISRYNVLLYPTHNPEALSGKAFTSEPPQFIDDVLAYKTKKRSKDKARALLIDFDNSARYNPGKENVKDKEELAARTGTPMYIARSVASGMLLERDDILYTQMPELSREALKMYIFAYTKEEYLNRNDENGQYHGCVIRVNPEDNNQSKSGGDLDTIALLVAQAREDDSDSDGSVESDDDFDAEESLENDNNTNQDDSLAAPPFYHRPDHDVESFFWVLLATLLRAKPRDTEDDPHLIDYWDAYNMFLLHSIRAGQLGDSRTDLLQYGEERFRKILHPKLHEVAPMLVKMAKQIRPEYGHFNPPPAPDHLHEAMRRLLLEQIVRMVDAKKSIPLERGSLRPLRQEVTIDNPLEQPNFQITPVASGTTSTKRKTGSQSQQSLNKKSKVQYNDKGIRPRHVDAGL